MVSLTKAAGKPPGDSLGRTRFQCIFMRPLVFWLRLSLGCVFIFASLDKIISPRAFAEIVHNYKILPDNLVNLAAIVLPWVEACLGVLLLLGLWLPGAVLLSNLLLLIFFGALVFNTARGISVHCGCFNTNAPRGVPPTSLYILRDAVFLCLGGALFFLVFPWKRRAAPQVERLDEDSGSKEDSL